MENDIDLKDQIPSSPPKPPPSPNNSITSNKDSSNDKDRDVEMDNQESLPNQQQQQQQENSPPNSTSVSSDLPTDSTTEKKRDSPDDDEDDEDYQTPHSTTPDPWLITQNDVTITSMIGLASITENHSQENTKDQEQEQQQQQLEEQQKLEEQVLQKKQLEEQQQFQQQQQMLAQQHMLQQQQQQPQVSITNNQEQPIVIEQPTPPLSQSQREPIVEQQQQQKQQKSLPTNTDPLGDSLSEETPQERLESLVYISSKVVQQNITITPDTCDGIIIEKKESTIKKIFNYLTDWVPPSTFGLKNFTQEFSHDWFKKNSISGLNSDGMMSIIHQQIYTYPTHTLWFIINNFLVFKNLTFEIRQQILGCLVDNLPSNATFSNAKKMNKNIFPTQLFIEFLSFELDPRIHSFFLLHALNSSFVLKNSNLADSTLVKINLRDPVYRRALLENLKTISSDIVSDVVFPFLFKELKLTKPNQVNYSDALFIFDVLSFYLTKDLNTPIVLFRVLILCILENPLNNIVTNDNADLLCLELLHKSPELFSLVNSHFGKMESKMRKFLATFKDLDLLLRYISLDQFIPYIKKERIFELFETGKHFKVFSCKDTPLIIDLKHHLAKTCINQNLGLLIEYSFNYPFEGFSLSQEFTFTTADVNKILKLDIDHSKANPQQMLSKQSHPIYFKICKLFSKDPKQARFHSERAMQISPFKSLPLLYILCLIEFCQKVLENFDYSFEDAIKIIRFNLKLVHWDQESLELSSLQKQIYQLCCERYIDVINNFYNKDNEVYLLELFGSGIQKSMLFKDLPIHIDDLSRLRLAFDQNTKFYNSLEQLYKYLKSINVFLKEFTLPDVHTTPQKKIELLRDYLLHSPCFRLFSEDVLEKMILLHKSSFFDTIFKFYWPQEPTSRTNVNIGSIFYKSVELLQKVVMKDPNLSLDYDILVKLSDKKIDLQREFNLISEIIPNASTYQGFDEFLQQSIELYNIQSTLDSFYSFFENCKFLQITDFLQVKDNITQKLKVISSKQIQLSDSRKVQKEISKLLGNIGVSQIKIFEFIQLDHLDFFSDFKDETDFDQRNQIITTNLVSDVFNSNLVDSTILMFKSLLPLVEIYKQFKVDEQPIEIEIAEFCQRIAVNLPQRIDEIETFIDKMVFVSDNITPVKSLYSSAGGTYTGTSILPTLVNLLNESEFHSITPKSKSGALGWCIKLNGNVEFSSEKLNDYVRGLKLHPSISDYQKGILELFEDLCNTLQKIHNQHIELDKLYHPASHNGHIQLEIVERDLEPIKQESEYYQECIDSWKQLVSSFNPRIRLLREAGISSLVRNIEDSFSAQRHYEQIQTMGVDNQDDEEELEEELEDELGEELEEDDNLLLTKVVPVPQVEPYDLVLDLTYQLFSSVKYCYSKSSEITFEKIYATLLGLELVEENFINSAFDAFETIFTEDAMTYNTGPRLVYLESKQDIFLSIAELNDCVFPHPNQIFYSHKINNELDDFFYLLETFTNRNFFLIGLPDKRQKLLSWFSDKYNDNEHNNLARLYIICTESSDVFEFFEKHEYEREIQWEQMKEIWMNSKDHNIEELVLVSGESGSGKTLFINQAAQLVKDKMSVVTLLIRPSTTYQEFVDIIKNQEKEEIFLHINVTAYCNQEFNQFIYPLLTYGFFFDESTGEIININDDFKLTIYVEIGSPLKDFPLPAHEKDPKSACKHFAMATIPLVYHLSHKPHYSLQWIKQESEGICLSYYYNLETSKFYTERPRVNQNITLETYFEHVQQIIGGLHRTHYLLDPRYLQHRKNYFLLLKERLDYLGQYFTYALFMQQSGFPLPISVEELYVIFLVECVKLADPHLCSVKNIWENPPLITSRAVLVDDGFTYTIPGFIDFRDTKRGLIPPVDSTFTLERAKNNINEFFAAIAQCVGIQSRTGIVNSLSHQYNYVLTPEFALRILLLHEKIKNQKSMVLTGDTGTGKTYILMFYSALLNAKHDDLPNILYDVKEFINAKMKKFPNDFNQPLIDPNFNEIIATAHALSALYDQEGEQAKFFNQLEALIQKILQNTPLIDLSPNDILYQVKQSLFGSTITTNQEMERVLKDLGSIKFHNLFHRIIMHQKFNSKEFKANVGELVKKAELVNTINQSLKLIVFIDEFNTSPDDTMALINELFIDGTLDGKDLGVGNIFWIGAMNPKFKSNDSIDFTGTVSPTTNQDFVVKDPPPSMNQLTFDFGKFSEDSEKTFVQILFSQKTDMNPRYKSDLEEFILLSQQILRQADQVRTHVSMRDITRAVDLYTFFFYNSIGKRIVKAPYRRELNNSECHWISLVLSMALTYYVRLFPGRKRDIMESKFNDFLYSNGESMGSVDVKFTTLFKKQYSSLAKMTQIPQGIALTESLMLNIFCTLVSINCNIPLCIVGPPGCSKTLSFTIIVDNMNATTTKDSPYHFMPSVQPFRYQCTQHTTDIEIKSKFEQAINREKAINSEQTRCVVFFDEAGLVNEDDSPMKVMHDYLDKLGNKVGTSKDNIGTIILSNKILDAAKTNRMMMLIHPESISDDDKSALVVGCLYNNKETLSPDEQRIVKGLCNSYKKVNNFTANIKKNLFHQRDFVFFLRHLRREYLENKVDFSLALLDSLERNFRGIPHSDFHSLAKEFYKDMGLAEPPATTTNNTIQTIKNSLKENMNDDQHSSTLTFRYIMCIDPSENESSLQILKEIGIEHKVIRVGGFENDKSEESLVQVVSEIKSLMATPTTVVLVNTEAIDACFYEVFNRYFLLMPSDEKDSKKNFMANISFGTHSIYCKVHPEFKIIIHMPVSRLNDTQLPWLNRFEKYYLSIDLLNLNEGSIKGYNSHRMAAEHFVKEVHEKQSKDLLLSGFSKSETIPSLLHSLFKSKAKDFSLTPTEGLSLQTTINFKLLQLARPELVMKYKYVFPPNYLKEYFHNQEHFSIIRFLHQLFDNKFNKAKNQSNKWNIFTKSSISLLSLKEAEVSNILASILVENMHQEETNGNKVKILQLSSLQTSFECATILENFKKSASDNILIVIADHSINHNILNFVFNIMSDLDDSKLFINIYHFPPELSLNPSLKINSIFLNDMEFIHIDSLGVKFDVTNTNNTTNKYQSNIESDIRSLVYSACNLDNENVIQKDFVYELLKQLFFDQLSTIASEMGNSSYQLYRLSPETRAFYTNPEERVRVLVGLFEKNPAWYQSIIENFTNHFINKNYFDEILNNISGSLIHGKETQPIIEAIKSSLTSFIFPVVSNIIKMLCSNHAIGRIIDISNKYHGETTTIGNYENMYANENYQLVSLFIKASESIHLSAQIVKRMEAIILPVPKRNSEPALPLYDNFEQSMLAIFNTVLQSNEKKVPKDPSTNYVHFVALIKDKPIRQVVEFINHSPRLTNLFKKDFVKRSLGITEPEITDFFVEVMDIILPYHDTESKEYSHIVQYFIIQHYHLDLVKFIYNSLTPILHLTTIETFNADFRTNVLLDQNSGIRDGDITKLKSYFIKFSISQLYQYLDQLKHQVLDPNDPTNQYHQYIINEDPHEAINLWLRVSTDLFNRIKIHNIIQHTNELDDIVLFYIHNIYQVLTYLDFSHGDGTEILNNFFLCSFNFNTMDIAQLVDYFTSGDMFIKLPFTCILDIIQPLIMYNEHNKRSFISLINNQHPRIPMGWACLLFQKLFATDPIAITNYCNQELGKDINLVKRILSPFSGHFQNIKPFVEKNYPKLERDIGQLVENQPLVDIIYFSLIELKRPEIKIEANTQHFVGEYMRLNNRYGSFSISTARPPADFDVIDRILFVSLSSLFIERLADDINSKEFDDIVKDLHRKELAKVYQLILNSSFQYNDNVQAVLYQVYLLKKIINDKTLTDFLQCKELLEVLAIGNLYIDKEVLAIDPWVMPYVYDKTVPQHQIYSTILQIINLESIHEMSNYINTVDITNEQSIGFIRMALFILTYKFYMNDQNDKLKFIRSVIVHGNIQNRLRLSPYLSHFFKIIDHNFTMDRQIDHMLFNKMNRSKETNLMAYTIINYVAVSMGSPKTHLWHLLINPKQVIDTNYPGCDNGKFVDCNMVYDFFGSKVTTCMGGIVLHKFIITTMSWSTLSYHTSVMNWEYHHYTGTHLINFPKDAQKACDYILDRSTASFKEVLECEQYIHRNIDPIMLLSHLSFNLWDQSFKTGPEYRSTFPDLRAITHYEQSFNRIIFDIENRFVALKNIMNESGLESRETIANILKVRDIQATFMSSPFISFESIHNLLNRNKDSADNDGLQVLHFFMDKINKICVSQYFSSLIKFLKMFFKYNAHVLPLEYQNNSIKQSFKYLVQSKSETKESIASLKASFDEFVESWSLVQKNLSVMEGCPRANDFEKVIPLVDASTPLLPLFFNNGDKGLIIGLITDWLDHTQTTILNLTKEIDLPTNISTVLQGFYESNKFDICDIPSEFGHNYMLIGSNFNENDFYSFIKLEISKYQTFNRNDFAPNWKQIQNRMILNYISGKSIQGEQFKDYGKEFPYNTRLATEYKKDLNNNNNNSSKNQESFSLDISPKSIEQQYITELNELLDSVVNDAFKEELSKEFNIQLSSQLRKVNSNEMELFGVYLRDTLNKVLKIDMSQPLEISKQKIIKFSPNPRLEAISKKISVLLSQIPLSMIKSVVNVFFHSAKGYKYYTNLIPEPVEPDSQIKGTIFQISKKIQQLCGNSIERIKVSIEYLQNFINAILHSSLDKFIKNAQPHYPLVQLFKKSRIPPQPPTLLDIDLINSISKEILCSYFSIFMEMVQTTLSILHLKLCDLLSQQEYVFQELDIETINTNNNIQQKSIKAGVATLPTKPLIAVAKRLTPPPAPVEIPSTSNLVERHRVTAPKEYIQKEYTPISFSEPLYREFDYIPRLFNWIQFIAFHMDIGHTPNEDFNIFLDSLKKRTLRSLDIKGLFNAIVANSKSTQDLIKRKPSHLLFLPPSEMLISILNSLSVLLGNKSIPSLYMGEAQSYCMNCEVSFGPINDQLNLSAKINMNEGINEQSLREHMIHYLDQQSLVCKVCFEKSAIKLLSCPQYIFIDVNRYLDGEMKHDRVYHPDLLDLSTDINPNTMYQLDAVLCLEDRIHIHSFENNTKTLVCDSEKNVFADSKSKIADFESVNSTMLIYKKSSVIPTSAIPTTIDESNNTNTNTNNSNSDDNDVLMNDIQKNQVLENGDEQEMDTSTDNNNNTDNNNDSNNNNLRPLKKLKSYESSVNQQPQQQDKWFGKSKQELESDELNDTFIDWLNNQGLKDLKYIIECLEGESILDFKTAFTLEENDWKDAIKKIGSRKMFLSKFSIIHK
ncbi:hypothetical protein CYY_007999 [Polysphondylium violaceum]|uniref:AAA+ ATPase domain-containing protein n=1 Tax=Polysphondylium violaceum TaxID=133409 RepID=A0A8J4PR22_9MYCE|nr:hypothetical protein CYY_007999 [Polysphondylium violaceum]